MLRLTENEEIPADLLLFSFNSASEYAYIETKNLDGESNLKPKVSIFEKFQDENDILSSYEDITIDY